MHQIEYDGAHPAAPWKITADTGESWHAVSEVEAAAQLTTFIVVRAHGTRRYAPEPPAQLPEGVTVI
jgi:hypothetical protein